MNFAELHCVSNYSFLRGASHPEELVQRCGQLGYRALALTDECSFAGLVKAHVAARECGIKLIVGAEFRLQEEATFCISCCWRRIAAPTASSPR
jgi:error-prone DNA polymerase